MLRQLECHLWRDVSTTFIEAVLLIGLNIQELFKVDLIVPCHATSLFELKLRRFRLNRLPLTGQVFGWCHRLILITSVDRLRYLLQLLLLDEVFEADGVVDGEVYALNLCHLVGRDPF